MHEMFEKQTQQVMFHKSLTPTPRVSEDGSYKLLVIACLSQTNEKQLMKTH